MSPHFFLQVWTGLGVCLVSITASAAELAAKDRVVFLHDVELREGAKSGGKIYAGQSGDVLEVQKDKVRVEYVGRTGWLKAEDVASRSDAWKHFSDRIRKDPGDWEALRARAPFWMDQSKHERALADLNAALAVNPRDPQTWRFRGMMHLITKENDKAFADLSEAIRLDPTLRKGHFLRATATLAKGGMLVVKHESHQLGFDWSVSKDGSSLKEVREQVLEDLGKAIAAESDGEAEVMRGFVRHFDQDFDEAISDATAALRKNPGLPEAFLVRGWTYREKGEYAKAVADLNKCLERQPRADFPLELRASIYFVLKDYRSALADESARIRAKPSADAYFMRALARYAQYWPTETRIEENRRLSFTWPPQRMPNGFQVPSEDAEQILADFEAAEKLADGAKGNLSIRGIVHFGLGQYEKAITDMTEARRRDDAKTPEVLKFRGMAYLMTDQLKLAYADFVEAIKEHPGDTTLIAYRGSAALRLGKLDEGIADLSDAIKAEPLAWLHLERGTGWLQRGNRENAAADYDRAIELDKKMGEARVRRGIVHCLNKDYEKGMDCLREGLRLEPDSALGYAWRGYAWMSTHELEKGVKDCEHAIKLDSTCGDAYLHRGMISYSRKQYPKAAADFEEAVRRPFTTKPLAAHVYRICAYLEDQRFEKALQCCDETQKLVGDDPEVVALKEKATAGLQPKRK
jgi:tetratricopeptide (TPR) repeat protein